MSHATEIWPAPPSRKLTRTMLLRLVCAVVSASLTLSIAEAAYRCIRYRQLCQSILFSDPSNTGDIFDKQMGYRRRPNQAFAAYPTAPGLSPRVWKTNSHGHIADADYPIKKPVGKLRIAVIGDSFTAGVTNSVRWTSILEERLNQNSAWQEKWKKQTRVLNLGLEGIGVVQFQDVFEQEAVRFEPDIVIVNLIADDLRRRRYWRGHPERPEDEEELQQFLRHEMLGPLPWFGLHLEMLSAATPTRRLGFRPRLNPRDYSDGDEALAASLSSLRQIKRNHPRVLILQHPMFEEYGRGLDSFRTGLLKRLYMEGADLGVVRMKEHLPDPSALGIDPVTSWYQRPNDTHPNDAGMQIYGEAVARVVLSRIAP